MKALSFERTGKPSEVLQLREIDTPEPGPGEVRLKLLGSPINPSDEMFITGHYRLKPAFPQIAGLEGAGIIESGGDKVDLPAGRKASFFAKNAWADCVVVPAADLFVLPDSLPDEKAIQSFLNPVTSWGLLETAGAKEGEWLLLSAGNSSVSRITTQIAAMRGINVIDVVRRPGYSDELKSLGAKEVIDSSADEISSRVMEITGGHGADAVLDSVGGKTGTEMLKCAAGNGRVVIYGVLSRDPAEFRNSQFLYNNLTVRGFSVRGYFAGRTPEQRSAMFASLADFLGRDDFRLAVSASYPLESYREALADHHERGGRGKVIFRPR